MATITIKKKPHSKQFTIKMDAEKFERLAANLGFFNADFLDSVARSEREINTGKTKRLQSLKKFRVK
ncbi:hypothetical protein HYT01_01450 [Candidatus Giovannonibacteria bacterium]|nr:hypothetical protein [Candidatus Giovannonibacteria bacterium]